MSEETYSSRQIAQTVTGFLDKHATNLWKGIRSVYRKASDETRLNWRLGYERYLERALNRYFFAKPFLSTNAPLPLDDFYVPLGVSCGETVIENTSIDDLMLANKFAVIAATGGSGKTMMMRHLFLDTIRKTRRVPIFVELRDLNNSGSTLFELIRKKLRDNDFDFSDDYIHKAFQAGHFALFLDGFDEIAFLKRKQISREIEEISEKFEKNFIVLSSRPDETLAQWTLFHVWSILPLSLNRACSLVEKTETDDEVKNQFIGALKEGLFEKHRSFLSNPLLLSIMLITYRENANIPQKLSTFYERAYAVLFEQHDARKGAFFREKRSKLDILEFRRVFATFCFLTYNRRVFSFSETDVFEFLEKAQKLSALDFSKRDYLDDSIQAVCLLLRDGLEITFSHRSFQEYFTALYISQLSGPSNRQKAVQRLLACSELQMPLFLLYEIAPEVIERHLIIPFIEQMEKEIGYRGRSHARHYKRFIRVLLGGIGYDVRQQTLFIKASESPGYDPGSGQFDLRSIYKYYWSIFANYITDEPRQLPSGKFEKRFSAFCESRYLESHEDSAPGIYVKIEKFLENRSLLSAFAGEEHIYSKRTLEDLIRAKVLLIRKHQEQEAFFDEEIFGS